MRIYLTGITGVVGRRLIGRLLEAGDDVVAVTRTPEVHRDAPGLERVGWIEGDPTCPGDWQSAVDGAEVVVHLAGSGLGDEPLDDAGREALRARRLDSTFQVVTAIEDAKRRPRRLVLLTNRLAEATAAPGEKIGELVRSWEGEAFKLPSQRIGVLALRAGFVLDPAGACLRDLGSMTAGGHPVGWVHLDDLVTSLELAIRSDATGVRDAVAPERPSASEFAKAVSDLRTSAQRAAAEAPRAEGVALLECPLPFKATGSDAGPVHEFRFKTMRSALEDLFEGESPASEPVPTSSVQGSERRSSSRRRLVVLPCEGLLVDGNGLLPESRDMVARLHAAGMLVVLATSRGGHLPLGLARQVDAVAPVIAADGSFIIDPVKGETIRTELLTAERVAGIVMAIRTSEPRSSVVVERGIHVTTDQEETLADSIKELVSVGECVDSGSLLARPATRILIHAAPRRLQRALSVVRDTWWRDRIIAIHQHEPDLVAITAPTADRGVALQRVESVLGVSRGDGFVVASSSRDVGLLEVSGTGFLLPEAGVEPVGTHCRSLDSASIEELLEVLLEAHRIGRMRSAVSR